VNPNGRSNKDVVRPFVNAKDVVQKSRNRWIVDFGIDMMEHQAALYESPYQFIKQGVYPDRSHNRREAYRLRWWQHGEARPRMRAALNGKARYLVTPRVAKHRLFTRLCSEVLPGNKLVVFARDDDYFFGVLHSRIHEVWSIRPGA
jgi:hypothetical protein